MQLLLGRLAADDVVGFRPRPVPARDRHGYEAEIPSGRNHAESHPVGSRWNRPYGPWLSEHFRAMCRWVTEH